MRVSTRTGRIIPYPSPRLPEVVDGPRDTAPELAAKETFNTPLATFEQDLMQELGIKDERKPYPTWFY